MATPIHKITEDLFIEISGWEKPEKIIKREKFVEKYNVKLIVVTDKPTTSSIQKLIEEIKGGDA